MLIERIRPLREGDGNRLLDDVSERAVDQQLPPSQSNSTAAAEQNWRGGQAREIFRRLSHPSFPFKLLTMTKSELLEVPTGTTGAVHIIYDFCTEAEERFLLEVCQLSLNSLRRVSHGMGES